MGYDQHLAPLPENLSPHGVSNMYRMPNQVPMQRSMRPMVRPNMPSMVRPNMPPHMISVRGRGNVPRATSMNLI